MSRLLEHVKVLEVSMWAYVPSAGAVLADWGADVVKVEQPVVGDPLRGLSIGGVVGATEDGFNAWWELYNRGKRSVGIDLHSERGRELLLQLVDGCDVFLTSLLPAARRKFGIDVDDIRARKPDIIYACGSGVGPAGPENEKGGYDGMTFWGRGGPQAALTPPGAKPILMAAPAFGDVTSGMALAGGVAAALANRAVTGEGHVVDGSLLATAAWMMQASVAYADNPAASELLSTTTAPTIFNPIANTYRTSDDRWVSLMMLQADKYWGELCRTVLERPELADDPRFADIKVRGENAQACVSILEEIFATRPLGEWRERLSRQDGQWEAIQTAAELARDPQAVVNGYVQEVDYGDRTVPMASAPVHFDRTSPTLGHSPELGADTEAVLLELGLDWDQIIELKAADAIT